MVRNSQNQGERVIQHLKGLTLLNTGTSPSFKKSTGIISAFSSFSRFKLNPYNNHARLMNRSFHKVYARTYSSITTEGEVVSFCNIEIGSIFTSCKVIIDVAR